ncbi:MAG: MopE-related protein [Polyangiaceae bacterium]
MKRFGLTAAFVASAAFGLWGTTGCTTAGFCFDDCGTGGTAASGTGGDGGPGGTGGINIDGGGTGGTGGGIVFPDAGDACVKSGDEICNGIDDDCNGKIDDGFDWTKPEHCGTCDLNCTQIPHSVEQTCEPPTTLDGKTPGTCKFKCEQDFYDDKTKPGADCSYQCTWNPNGTNTTDPGGAFGCEKDDDCDGEVDEDVDTCKDLENCGKCGKKCDLPNATPKCVTTAASGTPCTDKNTGCEIDSCTAGYADVNKSPDDGCEYKCPTATVGPEVCDGQDNDCDGLIDNADPSLQTDDQDLGDTCSGGTQGVCADPANQGVKKCMGGKIECCDSDSNNINGTNPAFPVTGLRNGVCDSPNGPQVIKPGDKLEKCNNLDDDCNGTKDDNPTDEGGKCGVSDTGNCQKGTEQCQNGALVCVGKIDPAAEICNGQDDDCDGVIDGTIPAGAPKTCATSANCTSTEWCAQVGAAKQCVNSPTDAAGDCAPPGLQLPVPPPCQKGALACVGGVKQCVGAVGPTGQSDACGVDTNCDGTLTGQPNLQTDVKNCGTCGHDCTQLSPGGHGTWTCQTGTCVRTGCDSGFINCDGNNNDCEKACTFVSNNEQCNGIDDNCNCLVDDNISNTPTPVQVCGVAAAATDNGCKSTSQGGLVQVSCTNGGWQCTFPATYCTGTKPNYCPGTVDTCDGKDNNCNGAADENYKLPILTQGYLTQPCASDDGKPPPGDGACRGTGQFVCNPAGTGTVCNAAKNNGAAGPELCDAIDNDCDGLVDEQYQAKGTNLTYFVKPAVTKIAASLWISQYEMSRTGATNSNPGSGNGYQTSAPTGSTIDKVQACSASGVIPWFNITPVEAAQTCAARGGRLCSTTEWTSACQATSTCKWGYNPRGAACTSVAAPPTKFCNLGAFDFDTATPGNQDGLLPTSSASLANCWADWANLQGNVAANNNIRDVTGNLREITYNSALSPVGCNQTATNSTCLFTLMGGAFNSDSEDGSACDFTFFTVDAQYKLFDVGFRCCFAADPTL